MKSPSPAELLIVSGGSEIVSLALAEAAYLAGIPYAVFALVPHSLLQGVPGCVAFVELAPLLGAWPALGDGFLHALARLERSDAAPLAILPTDDGSLRLLNECRDQVLRYGEFPRARSLQMGGLDKAEVLEMAISKGVDASLAPSSILVNVEETVTAFEVFGTDAVFKPALKPIDMDLSGMGGRGEKVITRRDKDESLASVQARLQRAWGLSERWIAQPRLQVGAGIERSVCAIRSAVGTIRACQVVEQAKYPQIGGTAYWVATESCRDLVPQAESLLAALDVVGVCELSYLPDAVGRGQMIELNPRPWLQIGLLEHAGYSAITSTVAALRGYEIEVLPLEPLSREWVQLERAILALFSRSVTLHQFGRLLASACRPTTLVAGYGSHFPQVRRRMLMKNILRLFG